MRQKLQVIDGISNRSISQNRTERGREISESLNQPSLLSELLFVNIIDSEEMFECKQSEHEKCFKREREKKMI